MNPTDHQLRALTIVADFLASDQRIMRLEGFAGTGKTSCIRWICEARETAHRPTVLLCPTGKAALRLREVTGRGAMTLHKLIYKPSQNHETGDVTFVLRPPEEFEHLRDALVVLDEASMCSKRMYIDLLSVLEAVDGRLILVGDPFQLEPVDDGDGFSALTLPVTHVARLTEVVRQALDSPVLRAATLVRTARGPMDVGRALAELPPCPSPPAVLAAERPDVPILVHRNATRHEINREARRILGRDPTGPVPGEPLLIMRNCYPVERYNGELVSLECWLPGTKIADAAVTDRKTGKSAYLRYGMAYVGGRKVCLCLDQIAGNLNGIGDFWVEVGAKKPWREGGFGGDPRSLADAFDDEELPVRPPLLCSNYGYCLTTHKAQGSEWDEVVLVLESSMPLHDVSGRRFLYTGLTRARKKVMVATT